MDTKISNDSVKKFIQEINTNNMWKELLEEICEYNQTVVLYTRDTNDDSSVLLHGTTKKLLIGILNVIDEVTNKNPMLQKLVLKSIEKLIEANSQADMNEINTILAAMMVLNNEDIN